MANAKTKAVEPTVAEDESTALINYEDLGDDFEFAPDGVDDAKVRVQMPRLILIQGTSKIEGSSKHAGEFYDEATQTYHETVSATPLRLQENRALFEEGKDIPVCMSMDNVSPLPRQPLWQQETVKTRGAGLVPVPFGGQPVKCAECPFSQWEGDKPPLCGEGLLALVQTEDGEFRSMRFTGTALGPVRNALKKLVLKMKRLPAYTALWTFSSKETSVGQNKWHQLVVQTTPHPVARIRELTQFIFSIQDTVIQQHQEAAETEVKTGAIKNEDDDVPFA